MKTLKDFSFKGKRVLVRCDFNVPLDQEGNILDDFRIKETIPTIEYLLNKGAKIILMSHLGKPKGKVVANLSLTPVQNKLMEYLDLSITKAPDCIGKEIKDWIEKMKPGEILLLENLRFHKGEEENSDEFVRELSQLGDIFINDAFGACHRAHASIVGIPKFLPSGAGFLLEKEVKVLSRVLENPERPLIVIIGGVKISTKIKVVEKFIKKADHLLLGGQIANLILSVKGICLRRLWLEKEVVKIIEKLDITNPKLHLPIDVVVSLPELETGSIRKTGLAEVRKEEEIYDIGPETIDNFSKIIKEAKMIFWSGPLGLFENKNFKIGTEKIAEAIVQNQNAFKIAGGGETSAFLKQFNFHDKFDHISTGGGAMLSFLAGEKLPGLQALKT